MVENMGHKETVVPLRSLPNPANQEGNDPMPIGDIDGRYDRTKAFKPAVGSRTHQAIGRYLASPDQPDDPLQRVIRLATIVRQLLRESPIVSGDPKEQVHFIRAGNAAITTLSAAYLNRFQPKTPWVFTGAEVKLGDLRLDLVFQNAETGSIIVDEIKTGGTLTIAEEVSQARSYAAAAAEHWPDAFGGVRLLYLRRPATSMLFRADGLPGVLLDRTQFSRLGDHR